MPGSMDFAEDRFREIVERCLRLVLSAGASLPAEDEDWVASGALDSMSHVDALLCIEKASSLPDLFARLEGDPPRTTQSVLAALQPLLSRRRSASSRVRLPTARGSRPLFRFRRRKAKSRWQEERASWPWSERRQAQGTSIGLCVAARRSGAFRRLAPYYMLSSWRVILAACWT